ncbi:DegT/DnrJ/EryC1/StrS family aminotransferase [Lysobacter silvisoli]|uniref:DegT/DnrJ/EryC1/StrS aminotransferase family protein n=1 Tax=Lysobacter silvisoli TaxID=2293254 RepID=A0A371K1P5_9GAMM|nr:DegT/DnrJ/EryC1/StrS family aminotransferase [Lysobacter silvisoli]RDZ27808.1 DegT/DnrJ/EryC1/StrS aminotransferase family protein [Lysobacter silvisoli]
MVPRQRPDIGWLDLACAAAYTLRGGDSARAQAQAEAAADELAGDGRHALVSLSVRSGFDRLLATLALPPGSEVLVSAVTIRDMVAVIEHHGLRAVPVDLDAETLALDETALAAALTPRSRMLLVAHLFGSRMPLQAALAFARRHGLLLVEDGAQAYTGDGWFGEPGCDVSLLSFGPIKTATALGGAVLRFADPRLCGRVRAAQALQPLQAGTAFARRVGKYALLKALTGRVAYGLVCGACRVLGIDHDGLINRSVRSFAGGELFQRVRQRPCAAQSRLLLRRLRGYPRARAALRAQRGERLLAALPLARPGRAATGASHWVLPVLSPDPARLIAGLYARGFDATCGASSLYAVPGAVPAGAGDLRRVMAAVVYLPAPEREGDLQGLALAVRATLGDGASLV